MKKILFCLSLILTGLFCLVAYGASERKAPIKSPIKGPEGAIYYKITLPKGFDPSKDHCPMVILMHGIFANQSINPMPALARKLADAGIASIRFDFNGHGKSQGRIQDMTIEKELADARAVWNYISSLPYVEGIGLLGHSQGGVVASMTAGRCGAAKSSWKRTAATRPCRWWRARTTPSRATGKRWWRARWGFSRRFSGNEIIVSLPQIHR